MLVAEEVLNPALAQGNATAAAATAREICRRVIVEQKEGDVFC